MKLVSLVVLIYCFALASLAQDQTPPPGPPSNPGIEFNCSLMCGSNWLAGRDQCRNEALSCFLDASDAFDRAYNSRLDHCDLLATDRTTCRLAALGWALARTSDQRQACASTKTQCLIEVEETWDACVRACYANAANATPDSDSVPDSDDGP